MNSPNIENARLVNARFQTSIITATARKNKAQFAETQAFPVRYDPLGFLEPQFFTLCDQLRSSGVPFAFFAMASTSRKTEREQTLSLFGMSKIISFEDPSHEPRFCESCKTPVGNLNLGGHDGKSALSGRLYCQACADEVEDTQ
jgi:hypothetical protein